MKYDFIFIYEVKNRELENICLLKYELEKRGYTVKLLETWNLLHHPKVKLYDAEIVITFALYNNGQAEMCGNYVKKINKMVNMQWEQVYSIGDEEDDASLYHLSGLALHAAHISWGKYNSDKLINQFGVSANNVWMVGQPSFDFFKPRLNGYYLSRSELCKKYCLDSTKQICLFISSFSFIGMPKSSLNDDIYKQISNSADSVLDVSIRSQQAIFDWLHETLPKNPNVIFVYRPHPAEVGNVELFEMEKELPNFRVIRDESVKQWIISCDKIYTWYSTSIAEAFAAHKEIFVLRPVELPRKMDIRLYYGCKFITNNTEFQMSLENQDSVLSLNVDMMNYYYHFSDNNEYTYEKIANKLEDMYKANEFSFNFNTYIPKRSLYSRFRSFVARNISNIIVQIAKRNDIISRKLLNIKRFSRYYEEYDFIERMAKNNFSSPKEIKKIEKHIKEVIEKKL